MAGGDLGTARARVLLEVADAIRGAQQFRGAMRDMEQGTTGAIGGIARTVDRNAESIRAVGGVLTSVGLVATSAFVGAARAGMDFEATLSGISAVADLTRAEMAQLSDLALKIGKDTSFGATDAAMAMEVLAKAGVSVDDILAGAAESAIALAEAGGGDLVQSTEIMTAAMAAFGISGEESIRVANALAGAANVSLADVSDLGIGLAQVGGVADAFGISLEETTAALAVLAEAGLSGSDAATSMKTSLLQLASPTQKQRDLMADLGIEITNADGSFKSLTDIIGEVDDATQGMTDSQRVAALEQLVGADGVRFLTFMLDAQNTVLADGTTEWDSFLAATSGGVQASDVAAKRLDNLRGDIEKFTGAIETIAIKATTLLMPAMRGVVQVVTGVADAIANLPAPILAAIAAVTGLVGVLALLAGGALLLAPNIAGAVTALDDLARQGGRLGAFATRVQSIGQLGPALLRLLNPIRLVSLAFRLLVGTNPILAALSLAVLAFQTDFLGFGTLVRSVASGVASAVSGFASRFREAFDAARAPIAGFTTTAEGVFARVGPGLNVVSAALSAFATVLRGLNGGNAPGWIVAIADGLDRLSGIVQSVVETFSAMRSAFTETWDSFGQLTGFVTTAEGVFAQYTGTVNGVSRVFLSLAAAIRKINGGDLPDWLEAVADGLETAAAIVERARATFRAFRDAGVNPLQAALATLSAVFPGLSRFIDPVRTALSTLTGTFTALRDLGLNPLRAAIGALQATFPAFMATFERIGAVVQGVIDTFRNLGEALSAFLGGDLREGFTQLGEAFTSLGETILNLALLIPTYLRDAFTAIDWAALGATLLAGMQTALGALASIGSTILSRLQDAVAGIDWAAVWSNVQDATSAIVSRLGDLGSALIGWIGSHIPSAEEWAHIADNAADIATTVVGKLGDLASAVLQYVRSAAPSAEQWLELAANAGGLALAALGKFGSLAAYLGAWLLDAVPSAETWLGLLSNAADLAAKAITAFGSLLERVLTWVQDAAPSADAWLALIANAAGLALAAIGLYGDLTGYVLAWLLDAVPGADAWLGLLANAADLATKAIAAFTDLAGKVVTWITSAVPGAETWLNLLSGAARLALAAVQQFGSLADYVLSWIEEAIPGADTWVGLIRNAADLVGSVLDKIGNLTQALLDWVQEAIPGVGTWLKIADNIPDISTLVTTALGNLSESVRGWVDAGLGAIANIGTTIAGLIPSGLKDTVIAAFQPIKDAINTVKGWFGFGDEDAPSATGGIEVSGIVAQFEADIAGAIDAMPAATIGQSVSNWIGRAVDFALGNVETAEVNTGAFSGIVTQFQTGLQTAFDTATEAGTLTTSIVTWFDRAVTAVGSQLAAVAGFASIRDAIDTEVRRQIDYMTGASLATSIAAWFGKAVTALAPLLITTLTGIRTTVDTAVTTDLGLMTGASLATALAGWFGRALPLLGVQLPTIFTGLRTAIETVIGIEIAAMTGASLAAGLFAWFGRGVALLGPLLVTAFASLRTAIDTVVVTDIGAMTGASLATALLAWITRAKVSLEAQIDMTTTAQRIADDLLTKVDPVLARLVTAYETAGRSIDTAMDALAREIDRAGAEAARALETMAREAERSTRGMVRSIDTAMADATAAIRGESRTWSGIIEGFAGAMRRAGEVVGLAAGDGVAAGLRARLGTVRNAANAIIDEVERAMNAAAEISSPSKMTTRIADFMIDGLLNPMVDRAVEAARTARRIVDAILSPLDALKDPVAVGFEVASTLQGIGVREVTAFARTLGSSLQRSTGLALAAQAAAIAKRQIGVLNRTLASVLQRRTVDALTGQLTRTAFDPIALTLASAGRVSAAPSISNVSNVTFERGSIVQQPGEDGEALARRVIDALTDAYTATGDI